MSRIGLSSASVCTVTNERMCTAIKRDAIKSDDPAADRVRVSIVSSSLARNRIRLSINTQTKSYAQRSRLWRRRRTGWPKREEREERQVETVGTLPAIPAADPIFFKRSAHSSWPDSLTIIKRKSFYFTVSSRPRSYFLPPPFPSLLFFSLSFSLSLSPPPSFFSCTFTLPLVSSSFFSLFHLSVIALWYCSQLFYYPIILICFAKDAITDEEYRGKENGIIT